MKFENFYVGHLTAPVITMPTLWKLARGMVPVVIRVVIIDSNITIMLLSASIATSA